MKKGIFSSMFSKVGALAFVLFSFLASTASAALTIEQQAVVDSVQLMVTDMTTVAWALVLSVTGVMITIKIFKKFIFKAT